MAEKVNGPEELKEQVRARYGEAALSFSDGCGCGCSCLGSGAYSPEEIGEMPENAARVSLGCGNPVALADLAPGEVVLDLGSGAGLDVLLSARRVGPNGKAYGLDMTDEMLTLARENQRKAGVANAEFLKGDIEAIPLPNDAVDVVISNCVINLAPEKDRVFAEIFRVLKPGGRLAVSDTVFMGENPRIPEALRMDVKAWGACVAGSLSESEYRTRLAEAGFVDVSIAVTQVIAAASCCGQGGSLPEGLKLGSAFVRARKPEDNA